MDIQPNTLPPKPQLGYASQTIPIANTYGLPSINVCSVFCYDSLNLRASLILPSDVYPPSWTNRNEVEQVIIKSALENDGTRLVRVKTEGQKHSYLGCHHGTIFKNKNHGEEKENGTRAGVKGACICNKDKSSRGPQARSEPKRSQTTKPILKKMSALSKSG
jgi:hypothetical protein